jgi:hypothetical protein
LLNAAQPTDNPFWSPQPIRICPTVQHHLQHNLIGDRLRPGESTEGGEVPCGRFESELSK